MAERSKDIKVTFLPDWREISLPAGTLASEAARLAGSPLNMSCGGRGTCGKCEVRFHSPAPAPTPEEERLLSEKLLSVGARLGCRCRLESDTTIKLPEKSRLVNTAASKEQKRLTTAVALDPVVRRVTIQLDPPTATDPRPDADRLAAALPAGVSAPGIDVLRRLPSVLRAGDFSVSAIIKNDRLLRVEPCLRPRPLLGVAVDIGTTTIGVRIFDLESGEETGAAAAPNPQAAFGGDVASRATYAREAREGLKILSTLAVAGVNRLIETAAGKSSDRIAEAVIVGNPIMTHIFLGIDPMPISVSPFVPSARGGVEASAESLSLKLMSGARAHVLPLVAGYVGADTVGALLAALASGEAALPALLIDFGTNAEIVLITEQGMYACAAAAGPALEGAQLSCGMGAYPGAVDSFSLDASGAPAFTTISDAPAVGICGTGALDLLAALLDCGAVEKSGRFADKQNWPEALRGRCVADDAGRPAFFIQSSGVKDILLTQSDIRQLQLARSAIASGAALLLQAAGLGADSLGSVLLAGALGTFLNPRTALRTGFMPRVQEDKILFIGNAALEGARRALLNTAERRRAEALAADIRYIELSGDPAFNTAFENNLIFD